MEPSRRFRYFAATEPARRFCYSEATEPAISLFLMFYVHKRPSPFFYNTPQNPLLMINDPSSNLAGVWWAEYNSK